MSCIAKLSVFGVKAPMLDQTGQIIAGQQPEPVISHIYVNLSRVTTILPINDGPVANLWAMQVDGYKGQFNVILTAEDLDNLASDDYSVDETEIELPTLSLPAPPPPSEVN